MFLSGSEFVQKHLGLGCKGSRTFDVGVLPGLLGLSKKELRLLDLLSVSGEQVARQVCQTSLLAPQQILCLLALASNTCLSSCGQAAQRDGSLCGLQCRKLASCHM